MQTTSRIVPLLLGCLTLGCLTLACSHEKGSLDDGSAELSRRGRERGRGHQDAGEPDAGGPGAPSADASSGASTDAGVTPDSGPATRAQGGFLESAHTVGSTDRLATASIVGSLPPAGGSFSFPAPYGTRAVRLTDAHSCSGTDCVRPVGYSYWRNINNHVGSDHLLVLLGLNQDRGGSGLTLYRVDKETLAVEDRGPVLAGTDLPTNTTGEGVYFSATMPHALYLHAGGRLLRVDVVTKAVETVFDAGARYGAGHIIWQHHTSDDDRVHSFTLRDARYSDVGCAVYFADSATFRLYPATGAFDECQVDRSGRWLVIKEDVDGAYGEDNRVIDLVTGEERVLLDRDGAAGHSDLGHGYMIAEDNWNARPGAYRVWDLSRPFAESGVLSYHDTAWGENAGDHVSHTNAVQGQPIDRQIACNSRLWAAGATNPRSGEIVCYRLDGSLEVLVVAPTLSVRGAPGGGDAYSAMPKGNLDVTGRWFVWTTNLGGDRLDAFLVRVPLELLLDP